MHATRLTIATATLAFALIGAPAFAQDVGTPAAQPAPLPEDAGLGGDSITVGGAVAYLPDYEGSDNYRIAPAPGAIGSYKGFAFTLAGNRANVDLIPNQPGPVIDLQFGPIGVVNFNRSDRDVIDDPRVALLPQRKTAIELGGYVGIGKTGVITSPYDKLTVSVSYRHDISGIHKSGLWQPSINYLTPLSRKAAVGLFASAERAERDYNLVYFSVTPVQSLASGLPAFNGRGGWKNYTLGGLATYALTGDLLHGFKIVAGGTYRRMLNDFADSPVVSVAGSRNQWLGAVGLAYTF